MFSGNQELIFESLPVEINGYKLKIRIWHDPEYRYWGTVRDRIVMEHYWEGPGVQWNATRELPAQSMEQAVRFCKAVQAKKIYKSATLVETNTKQPRNYVLAPSEGFSWTSQIEQSLKKIGF